MKKTYLWLAAAAVALAGCSKQEGDTTAPAPGPDAAPGMTRASFQMEVPVVQQEAITKAVIPQYDKNNFRILAFKTTDGGTSYLYAQDIPMDSLNLNTSTNSLSGEVQIPIGTYKFIPTYGMKAPGNYSWPTIDAPTALAEPPGSTHTGSTLPAIFTESRAYADLPSYDMGLKTSVPNKPVTATLKRAVSRVDILFIRATKDPATNAYTPIKGKNVFGDALPTKIQMQFTGVNNTMNLVGKRIAPASGAATFNTDYEVADLNKAVTMGSGDALAVGENGYVSYDNIQQTDIIDGSAHVHGAYLIPNDDNTATTGLTLVLTSANGEARTIDNLPLLPLEKNKVTLVKIHVLGDNVFTTGAELGVTVDTVWDGTNKIEGEIK